MPRFQRLVVQIAPFLHMVWQRTAVGAEMHPRHGLQGAPFLGGQFICTQNMEAGVRRPCCIRIGATVRHVPLPQRRQFAL